MSVYTVNPTTPATSLSIVVSGVAAANAKALGLWLDGKLTTITTTLGQTAVAATSALNTALLANLASGYSASLNGATITVTRADGGQMYAYAVTQDTGQSVALSGSGMAERILTDATVATTGRPVSALGGFSLGTPVPNTNGAVTVVCRVVLRNGSGIAKAARWRLWVYADGAGWYVEPALGLRTISDAAGAAPYAVIDAVTASVFGSRVAIELFDNNSAGNLSGTGLALDAWLSIVSAPSGNLD